MTSEMVSTIPCGIDKLLTEDDTLVLVGDHSWGRKLEDCQVDLQFIEELPGKKVMIRGNHDTFWNAKKTSMLGMMMTESLG